MTTVFQTGETIRIVGFSRDCECSHCGRGLKIGVKINSFGGAYGADCVAGAVKHYEYNGRRYRYSADRIRELAIIAGKGADCIARHNLNRRHFELQLRDNLNSI